MIKNFDQFLNEGKNSDYSELDWKMDKYMPEDVQQEYYSILDSSDTDEEKISALEEFFNEQADSERMDSYMPKNGTLKGFCEYLVGRQKKNKNKK